MPICEDSRATTSTAKSAATRKARAIATAAEKTATDRICDSVAPSVWEMYSLTWATEAPGSRCLRDCAVAFASAPPATSA